MRTHVALHPVGEGLVGGEQGVKFRIMRGQLVVGGRVEVRGDAGELSFGDGARAVLGERPFVLDLAPEGVDAEGLDQDLDARLPCVVTPAPAVVDAQDGLAVADQVLPGHEGRDLFGQDGRAAQTTADEHTKAQFAGVVAHQAEADVVHPQHDAVFSGTVEGDLELARQKGELGVVGRPLAQDLGERPRIGHLVDRHAGEGVGGDVADAVARGLVGMHLHAGQCGEHLGNGLQRRPVELDIGAGGEVGVAAVMVARQLGEFAQLAAGEMAVGHGDAEHRRVTLDVDAVLQAQRTELILRELPGEEAPHLVAELCNTFVEQMLVVFIVLVHVGSLCFVFGQ